MNSNSKRLTAILHATRSGKSFSQELSREAARVLTASTPEEVAHGTAQYLHDLLDASMKVLNVERQVLTAQIECKEQDGPLH